MFSVFRSFVIVHCCYLLYVLFIAVLLCLMYQDTDAYLLTSVAVLCSTHIIRLLLIELMVAMTIADISYCSFCWS